MSGLKEKGVFRAQKVEEGVKGKDWRDGNGRKEKTAGDGGIMT